MKRLRILGLTAIFAAGGGPVVAADSPPPPIEQGTLMGKLFGPKPPKRTGPSERSGPVTVTAPLSPEVVKGAYQAERDAYLRRMSVCTNLRRVALERGDEMLARQADELERQAGALFKARVAGLGVTGEKAPLPEASPYFVAEPMPVPDNLAAKTKANALVAPAAPVPGSTTAQVREVINP